MRREISRCFASLAREHLFLWFFAVQLKKWGQIKAEHHIFFQNLEEQHQQPLEMPVIDLLPNCF
jgi:hypothetical protein